MILIDAHCHLEPKDYPVVDEVIARARAEGLVHAVIVGLLQPDAFARGEEPPSTPLGLTGGPVSGREGGAAPPLRFGHALDLARAHPDFLSPTIGIHPHDSADATADDWAMLERTAALPEIIAIGEAGLDFFYDHSPREVQGESLRRQCQLAKKVGKPLVVHVRDAHDECAAILSAEGVRVGQIHCFTGDTAAARRYLDLGFHLSISGVVTYKKTEALQEAVKFAPLDRLLVETDSPYLAPLPWRGKKNEPGHVSETAKKVAALKGLDADEVALACARNTVKLFGLRVVVPG